MLDSEGSICCCLVVLAFGCAEMDDGRAALGEVDGHDCRVRAFVADFYANLWSNRLVEFVGEDAHCA